MIMPAFAVSVCVGRCGLGRADVVDALGWVGVAVDSELLAAGAAALEVRSLVPGLLHPAASRPAVTNAPARNVRRVDRLESLTLVLLS
jgi:hypothetical protein